VNRETLEKLGIKADTKFKLRTAEGEVMERDGGIAHVEVEGRAYRVPVIFGDKEDAQVLGVTTLEILGFEVDPVAGKLKPSEYLLLSTGS
jgi:predicted aspartyl protease